MTAPNSKGNENLDDLLIDEFDSLEVADMGNSSDQGHKHPSAGPSYPKLPSVSAASSSTTFKYPTPTRPLSAAATVPSNPAFGQKASPQGQHHHHPDVNHVPKPNASGHYPKDVPKPVSTPEQQAAVDISRKWKDVLVRAGLSIEFAWKYAIKLQQANYNETNALDLTSKILESKIGMKNANDRTALLHCIQEIAHEMMAPNQEDAVEEEAVEEVDEEDAEKQRKHALKSWRDLFMRARLGKEWGVSTTMRYASSLAKEGWDDWNVENLTDGDLETAGVANPAHREVIMQLIERELAEAELNPSQTFSKAAVAVTKEELEQMRTTKLELAERIEAFDVFQKRLSEILSGDTEYQNEARAKREARRAVERAERQQRRLDRQLNT